MGGAYPEPSWTPPQLSHSARGGHCGRRWTCLHLACGSLGRRWNMRRASGGCGVRLRTAGLIPHGDPPPPALRNVPKPWGNEVALATPWRPRPWGHCMYESVGGGSCVSHASISIASGGRYISISLCTSRFSAEVDQAFTLPAPAIFTPFIGQGYRRDQELWEGPQPAEGVWGRVRRTRCLIFSLQGFCPS